MTRMASIGMVILMLSGCDYIPVNYQGLETEGEQEELLEETGEVMVSCNVTVEGMSSEVMTKGMTVDGAEMTNLWVFDCKTNGCVLMAQQGSGEKDFGRVKFKVNRGEHLLAFVVSRGDDAEWSEATGNMVWGKVKDTFWTTRNLDTTDGSPAQLNVSLDRIAGKIGVTFMDIVPGELKKVTTYMSDWYYGISLKTGEGVGGLNSEASTSGEVEVDVPAAYVGSTGLQVSVWGFSRQAGFTTDVDFVWRYADGSTITEKRCEDVPVFKNRVTKITGKMLEEEASVDVGLNGTWGEDYEYGMK